MMKRHFALVLLMACAACSNETPPEAEPRPAPTIGEVTLAAPKDIRALVEAAKGTVVVMNIWATYCPPCVREMPELARFYRDHHGKGVTFISVGCDPIEAKDTTVVPWMKSYEIPFPVHLLDAPDGDTINRDLALDWDGSLPATFIYAPDGTLAWSGVGQSVTFDALVTRITPLAGK